MPPPLFPPFTKHIPSNLRDFQTLSTFSRPTFISIRKTRLSMNLWTRFFNSRTVRELPRPRQFQLMMLMAPCRAGTRTPLGAEYVTLFDPHKHFCIVYPFNQLAASSVSVPYSFVDPAPFFSSVSFLSSFVVCSHSNYIQYPLSFLWGFVIVLLCLSFLLDVYQEYRSFPYSEHLPIAICLLDSESDFYNSHLCKNLSLFYHMVLCDH